MKKLALLPIWTIILLLLVAADDGDTVPDQPKTPQFKLKTVVLDAGHGGKDPGACGDHGKEKDIVLSIVLKLGKYIEQHFPSVNVIYTRKTDVFVTLNERAAIANRNDADLFISVHVNAAGSPHAHGTEVWIMGQHKTEANLDVAKRENSVILLEEDYQKNYEYDPNNPVSHIVFTLFQNAYLEESAALANSIHLQFRDRARRHSRGVKQAGFVVLYKTSMPSVLIESGFITNAEEERFLMSDRGQDLLASGIFRAFRDYKETLEGDYLELGDGNILVDNNSAEPSGEHESTASSGEAVPQSGQTESQDQRDEEVSLQFRIQILASSRLKEIKQPPFSDLSPVFTEKTAGGIYRYFYGKFGKAHEATTGLEQARKAGFEDAFIVAYKNGQRIDNPNALVSSDD